jgi:hypothetical protein
MATTTILARLFRRVMPRRRHCPLAANVRAEQHPPAAAAPDSGAAARRLAEAIERAIDLGLWEHAERLAVSAAKLPHGGPGTSRLTECVARLRLARRQPEAALAIIESCAEPTASLRLLRLVCLLHLGRIAEAHADVLAWSDRGSAPLAARTLLALLEWRSGDEAAARAALARNVRQIDDARTLELLVLLSAAHGRENDAARWGQRLRALMQLAHGEHDVRTCISELMLESLELPGLTREVKPTARHVAALAAELAHAEHVIPALVEAQRIERQPATALLLREALMHALPEFSRPAAACEAIARLALLRDEHAEAAEWARRGVSHNPMSASLALLLAHAEAQLASQLARADESGQPMKRRVA